MERDGLEVLSEAEARLLLSQVPVGRVGVPDRGIALILPVNFMVLDEDLVFYSSEGAKLRAATAHSLVTFEADAFDPATNGGWSVLVVGVLEEVTSPSRRTAVEAAGLRPWAPGDRSHLLRVAPLSITGRRVRPAGRPREVLP